MKNIQPLNVIIGLGKTGLSCVNYLVSQGVPIAVMDTREDPPGLAQMHAQWPHVPITLGGLDEQLLLQAKEIIVSPGLSLHEPVLANVIAQGIPAIGDIELFARHAKAPVIAITGSNAKGTVTTLVGEMAKLAGLNVRVGGNIGTPPALDLLDAHEPDLYVLELSSFQLETTYTLAPTVAVILNISADHMDRYDALSDYVAAKQRVYNHAKAAVYNRDDQHTVPQTTTFLNKKTFGLQVPAAGEFGIVRHEGCDWLACGDQRLMLTTDVRIKGRHNTANALAALALGASIQLPMRAMLQALREFSGLPHRCQWVIEQANITWYNDSKGTNIGATLAAIEGLGHDISGKLILIAGGMGKGADFTILRPAVAKYVRAVILIGQDAPLLRTAWEGVTQLIDAKSMEEAVQVAHSVALSGDAVLLSPACASLDMFNNFEHRGEVFMDAVRGLMA